MALTLIAVVVALALGHVVPSLAASARDFAWYRRWLQWLDARFPAGFWRGRHGIALALLPPLLAVGLFQLALGKTAARLGRIAVSRSQCCSTAGGRATSTWTSRRSSPRPTPARGARPPPDCGRRGRPVADAPALVEAVFLNAQRRWFGVLLWFLLLGRLAPCCTG